MILSVIGVIFVAVTTLYLYLRFRPLRSQLNKLPHDPETNLILGNISLFDPRPPGQTLGEKVVVDIWDILFRNEFQKNGIMVYWIGPQPLVILSQAEHVEQLLSSNVQLEKGIQYSFTHRWLGTGLLTSAGNKWRGRRKMLTPSFHFKILEDFIPIMNGKTQILNEVIDAQLKKNNGFVADSSQLFLMCALDIICESAMGCDIGAQKNPTSTYVRAIHEMGLAILDRTVNPFLYLDFVYLFTQTGRNEMKNLKILHKFTNDVIVKKKKEIKELLDQGINPETHDEMGRKRKLAFMDSLITEHLKNPSFTIEHIREEVDTFMFEGHDTTAWGVTWTTFLLGHHPEIQAKVHEEMDTIFGSDRERDITMEDLREMKYLDMCIKEAQRIYPSVPMINRQLGEDMTFKVKGKEVTIPAGVEVAVFIYNLHHNKYLWEEPDKFDPERFTTENSKNKNPFAYVPFSAGPRNCIGQKFALLEEKAVLASVFRRFKVTSLVPKDEVKLIAALILKTDTPIKTKLELRA